MVLTRNLPLIFFSDNLSTITFKGTSFSPTEIESPLCSNVNEEGES